MFDRFLARAYRARTASVHGVDIVTDAWLNVPVGHRAAMAYAQGDPERAAACGGEAWVCLGKGDLAGALKAARKGKGVFNEYLEAEALIAAGGIMPGLSRLRKLHQQGEVNATLAFASRLYALGHHKKALEIAGSAPWHAHTAMVGARAALSQQNYQQASVLLEPLLTGLVPVPSPMMASGIAVLAATWMVGTGQSRRLQVFAHRLLTTIDTPESMLPTLARVAWIAGFAKEAWQKFNAQQSEWFAAALTELALLAGDATLAQNMIQLAGALGAPSAASLALLNGSILDQASVSSGQKMFPKDAKIHLWRTHPDRWQPWINAALQTQAEVEIYDLTQGRIPDLKVFPYMAIDDASLIDFLMPLTVTPKALQGQGIWIAPDLCQPITLTSAWPRENTDTLYQSLPQAKSPQAARVQVLPPDQALARANAGLAVVAIAPPGDPFWAGPVPERIWPNLRVVRSTKTGWQEAPAAVAKAVQDLADEEAQIFNV